MELEAAPEFDKKFVLKRRLRREVVAIAIAFTGGLPVTGQSISGCRGSPLSKLSKVRMVAFKTRDLGI